MNHLHECQSLIGQELEDFKQSLDGHQLYEPVSYILSLGGKRLRPALTLLSARAFGQEYSAAIHAALAVEVFHNFTLMHDDIMDEAPLRRGKSTVHEKWNVNAAILSGDAMLVLAYQLLNKCPLELRSELFDIFNQTALEVCEGQQQDMDFEERDDVSIEEYTEMIRLKTSVLLAAALKMGSRLGGANEKDAQAMYDFGVNLGIAFQLRDDYLDAFGDGEKVGKQIGGDILAGKKTYLLIHTLNTMAEGERESLMSLINERSMDSHSKVNEVKSLMLSHKADEALLAASDSYYRKGIDALNTIDQNNPYFAELREFAQQLMQRDH